MISLVYGVLCGAELSCKPSINKYLKLKCHVFTIVVCTSRNLELRASSFYGVQLLGEELLSECASATSNSYQCRKNKQINWNLRNYLNKYLNNFATYYILCILTLWDASMPEYCQNSQKVLNFQLFVHRHTSVLKR